MQPRTEVDARARRSLRPSAPACRTCTSASACTRWRRDSPRPSRTRWRSWVGSPVWSTVSWQAALASETVLSLVPEVLDDASGQVPTRGRRLPAVPRAFAERDRPPRFRTGATRRRRWSTSRSDRSPDRCPRSPGSSARRSMRSRSVEARVLMTVGRKVDAADLGPLPPNARVEQWLPQDAVLEHAAAMLGHGGFGTTMGALARGRPSGGRAALLLRPDRQRRARRGGGRRAHGREGADIDIGRAGRSTGPRAAGRSRATPRRPS